MKMRVKRLISVLCVLALVVGLVPMALAADTGYVHNFTAAGKQSSFYTITGNLSTSKGTVTYNGLTLTQCLKMESATSIKFTAPAAGKLTLVFVESAGTVKVDGTKLTASNGVVTTDVAKGSHTVTKADTANLFYMVYTSSAPAHTNHDWSEWETTKEASCTEEGQQTRHCTIEGCTATETQTIEKKPHTYKNGSSGICQECGIDSETGRLHAHTWDTDTVGADADGWVIDEEATCTKTGSKYRTCTNPDCGKVETETIPKTAHTWVGDECSVCHTKKPTATFTKVGGHFETAYAQWTFLTGVDQYKVYVKEAAADDSAYEQVDDELIRRYPTYMRVDAVGLEGGKSYVLKVEGLRGGVVQATLPITDPIPVLAHDRSGYAHFQNHIPGAYNMDGTLKSGAQVIYVTEQTKDTVEWKGFTGIQNILTAQKKNANGIPLCVRFIGNITDPATLTKGDLETKEATNGITLEGIGNDTVINGFGITVKGCTNVEVRNLGFMNCNSGEGDCLGIDANSQHIWAHNNDFFYGDAGSDADQAKGDGSLDTKNTLYVTHSYNHFWDSGKCNLVGMHEGSTKLNWLTFHHNWYDHSDSRHPRVRGATVHIYNNYFDGVAKYGPGATEKSNLFVEANYFRNVSKPMLISMQGTDIASGKGTFSGEDGGMIKSFGNKMVMENRTLTYKTHKDSATDFDAYEAESRNETVPDTYKTKQGGMAYNNFDTNSSLMYTYTPDTPDVAMQKVQQYAGRVEGGDFRWTFNNATEDANYGVIAELKSALTNYKGTLVAVGGKVPVIEDGGSTDPTDCKHDWRWTITTPATCEHEGVQTATCFKCGATGETKTIAKTAHSFVNGVCTVCGAQQGTVPDPDPVPGGNTKTYTLNVGDMTATVNTKDLVLRDQGTDNFFTVYGANKDAAMDYNATSHKFDNDTLSKALKTGGAMSVTDTVINSAIGFTTNGSATVKIWWRGGTSSSARHLIINQAGGTVATSQEALTSNDYDVTTLSLASSGTYYLGGQEGGNSIYKVEVTVTKVEETEPDVDHSGFLEGDENVRRDLKWYYKEDETLTVEQMETGDSVLAACYDDAGRLIGVKLITPTANVTQIDNTIPEVKLFWINEQKPMCEAAVAWGGEE